jgi:type IV secretory pathway TraG/TraD family ATPase VirD4
VVAPGGAPGYHGVGWSPIAAASDPDAADRIAEWMVDSSGMTGDPKARPWNAQARKYLKGCSSPHTRQMPASTSAKHRAAQTSGPINPRLLLALDEAGNVFRYPRLPHLLTTARGNGIQLLLIYHDIAQVEHLYGGREVARTVARLPQFVDR